MHSLHWSNEDGLALVMHHNGDYSGDIKFNLPPELIEDVSTCHEPRHMQVTIPFDAIKTLVAAYVSGIRIEALEDATPDDVLLGKVT